MAIIDTELEAGGSIYVTLQELFTAIESGTVKDADLVDQAVASGDTISATIINEIPTGASSDAVFTANSLPVSVNNIHVIIKSARSIRKKTITAYSSSSDYMITINRSQLGKVIKFTFQDIIVDGALIGDDAARGLYFYDG